MGRDCVERVLEYNLQREAAERDQTGASASPDPLFGSFQTQMTEGSYEPHPINNFRPASGDGR